MFMKYERRHGKSRSFTKNNLFKFYFINLLTTKAILLFTYSTFPHIFREDLLQRKIDSGSELNPKNIEKKIEKEKMKLNEGKRKK